MLPVDITETDLYPCPCCGYRVHAQPLSKAGCPICKWEDTEDQLKDPYFEGGSNGIALWNAQRNVMKSGLFNSEHRSSAGNPISTNVRDEPWRPIIKRLDDFGSSEQRVKITRYEEMCYWSKTFWNCSPIAVTDLEKAHGLSIYNRMQILESDLCGCFYCLEKFPPSEITEWVDGGLTPICPHCGIDSVVGASSGLPITSDFLKSMNKRWFG